MTAIGRALMSRPKMMLLAATFFCSLFNTP
jgi:ABC-type branched-subunit amino acid transport system ATPase component